MYSQLPALLPSTPALLTPLTLLITSGTCGTKGTAVAINWTPLIMKVPMNTGFRAWMTCLSRVSLTVQENEEKRSETESKNSHELQNERLVQEFTDVAVPRQLEDCFKCEQRCAIVCLHLDSDRRFFWRRCREITNAEKKMEKGWALQLLK